MWAREERERGGGACVSWPAFYLYDHFRRKENDLKIFSLVWLKRRRYLTPPQISACGGQWLGEEVVPGKGISRWTISDWKSERNTYLLSSCDCSVIWEGLVPRSSFFQSTRGRKRGRRFTEEMQWLCLPTMENFYLSPTSGEEEDGRYVGGGVLLPFLYSGSNNPNSCIWKKKSWRGKWYSCLGNNLIPIQLEREGRGNERKCVW